MISFSKLHTVKLEYKIVDVTIINDLKADFWHFVPSVSPKIGQVGQSK
jgi:hypothetical protein